jgi:hypothetical protein
MSCLMITQIEDKQRIFHSFFLFGNDFTTVDRKVVAFSQAIIYFLKTYYYVEVAVC